MIISFVSGLTVGLIIAFYRELLRFKTRFQNNEKRIQDLEESSYVSTSNAEKIYHDYNNRKAEVSNIVEPLSPQEISWRETEEIRKLSQQR